MHAHTISLVTYVLQQALRPRGVVTVCSRCNQIELVSVPFANVSGVATVKQTVIIRRHIATATPGLVAYSKISDLPRFVPSVSPAHLSDAALRV